MLKLKKAEFNQKYRFREARKEGLVNCVSCENKIGGTNNKEGPAFCDHKERFRRMKLGEYWYSWGSGESENIASKRVCDAYTSKPLSKDIERPILFKKQAILLGTQHANPYHRDPNCPYVIEELRLEKSENKPRGEVRIIDLSDMVIGSTIRDICEMPCCEEKLPFQISIPNYYRQKIGIKPDGTEPIRWVRNGIVKHENKSNMTFEEAEIVFNLEVFNNFSGAPQDKIIEASHHLYKHCNGLGSRPLFKA